MSSTTTPPADPLAELKAAIETRFTGVTQQVAGVSEIANAARDAAAALGVRLTASDAAITARFDEAGAAVTARFEELIEESTRRFDGFERRVENHERSIDRLNGGANRTEQRIETLQQTVLADRRWGTFAWLALLAFLALLVFVALFAVKAFGGTATQTATVAPTPSASAPMNPSATPPSAPDAATPPAPSGQPSGGSPAAIPPADATPSQAPQQPTIIVVNPSSSTATANANGASDPRIPAPSATVIDGRVVEELRANDAVLADNANDLNGRVGSLEQFRKDVESAARTGVNPTTQVVPPVQTAPANDADLSAFLKDVEFMHIASSESMKTQYRLKIGRNASKLTAKFSRQRLCDEATARTGDPTFAAQLLDSVGVK